MPSPPLDHAAIVDLRRRWSRQSGVTHPVYPAGFGRWGAYRRTETGAGVAQSAVPVPELSAIAGTPAHRQLVDARRRRADIAEDASPNQRYRRARPPVPNTLPRPDCG